MTKVNHKWSLLFGMGLIFGGAGLIPGFSSGTMAYLFGVYPLLIGTYAAVIKTPKNPQVWMDVFVLLAAMGLGAYLVSIFLNYVLTAFFYPVMWVFIGFVFASVLPLIDKIKSVSSTHRYFSRLSLFFPFLLSLSFIQPFNVIPLPTPEFLGDGIFFVSSMFAALAGLLPGISGSVAWIAMGQYGRFLMAVNQILIPDLILYISGSLMGYILFSSLIDVLLNKFPLISYLVLTTITLLSVVWLIEFDASWTALGWLFNAFVPLVLGFLFVFAFYLKNKTQQERLS